MEYSRSAYSVALTMKLSIYVGLQPLSLVVRFNKMINLRMVSPAFVVGQVDTSGTVQDTAMDSRSRSDFGLGFGLRGNQTLSAGLSMVECAARVRACCGQASSHADAREAQLKSGHSKPSVSRLDQAVPLLSFFSTSSPTPSCRPTLTLCSFSF